MYNFVLTLGNKEFSVSCVVFTQVSLGNTNDLLAADYSADKLPRGKHSTKGLGRIEPDPAQNHTL